jgi:hypothetical protein
MTLSKVPDPGATGVPIGKRATSPDSLLGEIVPCEPPAHMMAEAAGKGPTITRPPAVSLTLVGPPVTPEVV